MERSEYDPQSCLPEHSWHHFGICNANTGSKTAKSANTEYRRFGPIQPFWDINFRKSNARKIVTPKTATQTKKLGKRTRYVTDPVTPLRNGENGWI